MWNFGAKYFQFKNELFTYYELLGRSVLNRSLMFAEVCFFVRILWRQISISYHCLVPMRLYGIVFLSHTIFFAAVKMDEIGTLFGTNQQTDDYIRFT